MPGGSPAASTRARTPGSPAAASAARSPDSDGPDRPLPTRRRSFSLAVTQQTRSPASDRAASRVGQRSCAGSIMGTSSPCSSRKWLPLMPWTSGRTPVTMETLFGLV